ncbi:hypothetical protein EJ02DRAFT_497097, partial [Clathrospora elynae]
RNITTGWAAFGLFPFNPERVLQHTPKPFSGLTASEASEAMFDSLDQILQTYITPITPVTTEALNSLHKMINQELNEPSKQRTKRHVQKLASAAKISFAKQILGQDKQQSSTSPIDKISGHLEGEGDEL